MEGLLFPPRSGCMSKSRASAAPPWVSTPKGWDITAQGKRSAALGSHSTPKGWDITAQGKRSAALGCQDRGKVFLPSPRLRGEGRQKRQDDPLSTAPRRVPR